MSIEKLKEPSSETITSLEQVKDGVLLIIGKKKILLSNDAYLSGYFYPGKTVSRDELKKLEKLSSQKKANTYVISLLNRKQYTEKELFRKLKTKFSLTEKEINDILKPYKDNSLIDDSEYIKETIVTLTESGYGPRRIEEKIFHMGFKEDLIKQKEVQELLSQSDIISPKILALSMKTTSTMTREKRKEKAYSFLIRRGFSQEEAKESIDSYFESQSREDLEKEEEKRSIYLKKESLKCYNSLVGRSLLPQKKKEKLINHLLSKGFNYNEIREVIEKEGYQFK